MKLTIGLSQLKRAVSIAARAASSSSILPVLENLLLDAQPEGLTVKATNLELGIVATAPAQVDEPGATTVPARAFANMLATLNEKTVTLEMVGAYGSHLQLHAGKHKSKFATIQAIEFPLLEVIKDGMQIDGQTFKHIINQVSGSASSDISRPVLTGIHIDQHNVQAVDGFRAAWAKWQLPEAIKAIIPANSVREMARLAGENISLAFKNGQAHFWSNGVGVLSQLIDGNYPDIEQILPKRYNLTATVSTAELLRAIKQVEIFAKDDFNQVRLDFNNNMLTVSGRAETGEADTEIPVVMDNSDPLTIYVNATFFREGITACHTERAKLSFINPTTPIRIEPDEYTGFLYIVVPQMLK